MEQTLLELLSLPETPHVVFENPPLALALCQVQFANVLNVANPGFVAPFQQAIQELYPIAGQAEQVQIELGLAPGDVGVRGQARSQQWRFTDDTDDWTVVLTPNFVALETRAYEDFKVFLTRLRQVLDAVTRHIRPPFVTRIGLRYIDEIRQTDLPGSSVVRQELLGPLASLNISKYAELSMQELILRFPKSRGINIHHGLFPNGTTVTPRSGETAPEGLFYLLDFDVFREFRPVQKQAMNPETICKHVAEYNKTIYQLFRWFVTDEYISTLEVRHDTD
jgi:uncharacterized protein (TIGR04255 family)